MSGRRLPVRIFGYAAVLAAILGGLTAGPGWAQTRSDTGRHQPPPPPEKEESVKEEPSARLAVFGETKWHVGMTGGIVGGSDLFRVEVVDGPPVPWDSMTRFQSSRFTASLDRNFGFGLFLTRDLSPVWAVRADFGYSRMDVAAEALVGQTGAVFLYDRMDVVNVGLGIEARLNRNASYPFVQGTILLSHLGPAVSDELEQTNWGGRLGIGYLHSFGRIWAVRFEARASRTGFSTGDYVPPADTFEPPEIDFQPTDHLTFYEFLIGVQASF